MMTRAVDLSGSKGRKSGWHNPVENTEGKDYLLGMLEGERLGERFKSANQSCMFPNPIPSGYGKRRINCPIVGACIPLGETGKGSETKRIQKSFEESTFLSALYLNAS